MEKDLESVSFGSRVTVTIVMPGFLKKLMVGIGIVNLYCTESNHCSSQCVAGLFLSRKIASS